MWKIKKFYNTPKLLGSYHKKIITANIWWIFFPGILNVWSFLYNWYNTLYSFLCTSSCI